MSQRVLPTIREQGGGSIGNIGHDGGILRRRAGGTFTKRIADPEEIVGPVGYLVSDASSFVTGDDLSVSGGMQK